MNAIIDIPGPSTESMPRSGSRRGRSVAIIDATKMLRTIFAGIIIFTCAILASAQSPSAQSHPDLDGAWKLNSQKSDLADDYRYALSLGEERVSLSVTDSEVKVTRRYSFGESNLTFYTDGRTATNRDTTGEAFKSTAKWDGRKLVARYTLHRDFGSNPENVDVVDEWTLSNDGKTLTLKTTLRYLQRGTDAAHREPFRGYVPRLWLKRVYDRI